jgi:hypothetical protein
VVAIRFAVWAVTASVRAARHQPPPPRPPHTSPFRSRSDPAAHRGPPVWRGHDRPLLSHDQVAALTWRDGAWWRTPVRDLVASRRSTAPDGDTN